MRALRWIIITGVVLIVVAVVAIAIGAAWLNTYIHSDAFKKDVETRAGDSVGGTVQIEKIDFDVFKGVKLAGFITKLDPEHTQGRGTLQVTIQSVDCSYAWTELFSGRLKLTGLTLDQPQIVLTQKGGTPQTAATMGTSTTSATTSTGNGQGSSMPFQFVLDRARMNDGSISVRSENGTSTAELKGVNVDANTAGYSEGKQVTGTLKIADILLSSNMRVTNFSTPFTYGQDTVLAKPFEASTFGGNLAGDYGLSPVSGENLVLNGKGIDVAQLTAAMISASAAKLTGSLDFQSKWIGVVSGELNGEGDAQLTNGKLTGVKILQDIGQILKIKELNEPIITKAQTHFTLQDNVIKFIGLQLNSTTFSITGDGTVDFNTNLNANLVLILTKDSMAKLPSQLAASFVQKPDGTGSISFTVTGTTSDPKTDLPQRLLMQNTQIKNVINKAINKLFH